MKGPSAQTQELSGADGTDQQAWSAFDHLPAAVVLCDREMRCRYANPAARRWFRRPDREPVLGRPVHELLSAEAWRADLPHVREALAGHPQQVERPLPDASGRASHVLATYTPYRHHGRVVGVLLQITDITARVDAEEERRRRAEDAAVARERERVAEGASSLIGRPLTAASRELTATLRGDGRNGPAERVRAAIRDIDAAVAELRTLVGGSRLARLDRPEPATDPDLAAAAAEVVAANVGDVVSTADAQGRLEWVSPSSVLVTGWAPADLVGRSAFELVHPDDEPLLRARWTEQVAGAPLVGVEYRRRRPDGTYQWVETRIRPLRGPTGLVTGAVASSRDVTERHRLQDELAEALEMFELGFTAAPIGKALVAPDGRWLKVNPALSTILHRSAAELLAGTFQDITHPDDLDADLQVVSEVLGGRRSGYEMEKRFLRPDGRVVWAQLSVAAARRADGTFRFFIVQVQDIGRRKADAEALQHRADHDPLTGLWNRRRFADELRACSHSGRRATDRPVLLVCDLDGFKTINDTHGHATGDAHLRDVAAVLRAAVRAGDGCARLGGDEFAVLLPDADDGTAAQIAARIVDRVAALGRGGVSIGTAAWSPDADVDGDIDGWLNRADRGMYEAKSRARSGALCTAR